MLAGTISRYRRDHDEGDGDRRGVQQCWGSSKGRETTRLLAMRIYVTGKVEGLTKEQVKALVESKGYEFHAFGPNTELLVYAGKPGRAKIARANSQGIRTMSWEEFATVLESSGNSASGVQGEHETGTLPHQSSDRYVAFPVEKRTKRTTFNVLRSSAFVWMNSMGLSRIDLAPVEGMANLERLYLQHNRLTEIDLSPLKDCKRLQWLNLSGNLLTGVDLQPLSLCTGLRVLELAQNRMGKVDLSPLSLCSELGTLVLSSNLISSADLSPLRECKGLKHLHLTNNKLTTIDLSPLSDCKSLQTLFIDSNNLTHVDLSGLQSCGFLCCLNLSHNQLEEVDLSPLSGLSNLCFLSIDNAGMIDVDLTPMVESWIDEMRKCRDRPTINVRESERYTRDILAYLDLDGCRRHTLLEISDNTVLLVDSTYRRQIESEDFPELHIRGEGISWVSGSELARRLYNRYGWTGLRKRLEFLPRKAALSALSMSELAGLDASAEEVMSWIPEDISFTDGLSQVHSIAVARLRQQLEESRETEGFDVEALKSTAAAVLIPRILEIRASEIRSLTLRLDERGEVDLQDLLKTHYGRRLAQELGLYQKTDMTGLQKILDAFAQIGLRIAVQHERSPDKEPESSR
ncbi:MAG: leucine-rich repeat domain-containing protein [Candidatus Thorarchaeota archaeon]|nr:leucine-rich repeat domain-containing protein [Candidatus Thorarchaeota archaeon]